MITIFKKGILLFLFFLVVTFASAQHAHINLGNLLESLPGMKAANVKIENLQTTLATKGQAMVAAYQEKAAAISAKYQNGELSEKQAQQEADKLKKEEGRISAFDQEATAQIQNKRRELLQPILKKIDDAINSVAKEKGYKMIFDTSVFNALLYAKDTDDIMELVKAKL